MEDVKRCTVLYIDADHRRSDHVRTLTRLGFIVHAMPAWPQDDEDVVRYQAVIVRLADADEAPLVAMRIRTKRHFGRRVLIALVPPNTSGPELRAAQAAGFDAVVCEEAEPRLLAARLMRTLRQRPEYRCYLPRKNAA